MLLQIIFLSPESAEDANLFVGTDAGEGVSLLLSGGSRQASQSRCQGVQSLKWLSVFNSQDTQAKEVPGARKVGWGE